MSETRDLAAEARPRTRRTANQNEIGSTFAHAVANPPATTAPEFSPRNVKPLEKISAIESDMEELTQRQQRIRESIVALRALIKPKSVQRDKRSSELDDMLDPYILAAVRELLKDESRANGMVGDDEMIEDYLTALGKSSEEVDRRKRLQL
ncbi:MAG: hypothetical protein Q9192_006347 [Flavoplaca navasiana]